MLRQNPFSLYDFLGYFVPGAIFLYIAYFVAISSHTIFDIQNILDCTPNANTGGVLMFILAAYISGHILSYLSAISIEKYSNLRYGYPSQYLLNKKSNKKALSSWHGIVISIILFPYIALKIIDKIIKLDKELDVFLIDCINLKIKELLQKLKLDEEKYEEVSQTSLIDIHRIITHFVFDNSKQHQQKMVNYVSLYGLLRTISFISCIVSWIIIFRFRSTDNALIILALTCFICNISFMAFMKFYRRYTLESLMVLISTDLSEKSTAKD